MKKLFIVFTLIASISLTACGTTYQEATGQTETKSNDDFANGYFTVITEWGSYQIVYANDTKVKYLIKSGAYHFGITPLYNSDGTLQVYEERED